MTERAVALEVAVTSPYGAEQAKAAGADRLELCAGLELGGITPSQALIEATVAVGLPVHALIRCRPGGFSYREDDVRLMAMEVECAIRAGAVGVVVGALADRGDVDVPALTRLVAAARERDARVEVTFHRAIDQVPDPVAAIGQLVDLSVDRVLTSGGAAVAIDGVEVLRAVTARAHAAGIAVTAGGGVATTDIPALLDAGVDAVHLSAKRAVPRAEGAWTQLGTSDVGEVDHFETDGTIVASARAAVDGWRRRSAAV